jgi:hypothetical protein
LLHDLTNCLRIVISQSSGRTARNGSTRSSRTKRQSPLRSGNGWRQQSKQL